jgi:hypothetical protein
MMGSAGAGNSVAEEEGDERVFLLKKEKIPYKRMRIQR